MTTLFDVKLYGRFIEIQNKLRSEKLYTANKGSRFLQTGLAMKIMYELSSILEERQKQSPHLKKLFFFENRHPFSHGTRVIRLVK